MSYPYLNCYFVEQFFRLIFCFFRGSSASESSSSDSSDESTKSSNCRVYNVSGSPNDRDDDDDALPSSTLSTDNEDDDDDLDRKSSADEKERENDGEESSSGSADTDSNDTGTVADQKPKRFSRVFVVNRKGSSSDTSATSSSGASDSSDNDTDTERDCAVVLVNVKPLNPDDAPRKETLEDDCGAAGASLLGFRYVEEGGGEACSSVSRPNKTRSRRFGGKSKKKSKVSGKNEVPSVVALTKEDIKGFIESEVRFASDELGQVQVHSSKAERVCDKARYDEVSGGFIDSSNDTLPEKEGIKTKECVVAELDETIALNCASLAEVAVAVTEPGNKNHFFFTYKTLLLTIPIEAIVD